MLQRRFLCTQISNPHRKRSHRQWTIKQVTKSNFSNALEEIKNQIFDSDFIAVSLQKTGSYSAPWHRVLPFDTAGTAYFKAKYAAEKFQLLQFAVCPFSIRASTVIVNPYNFNLFPRDELKMGMPSYSFSCQSSYLTSMAREGFDFNVCIYEGISYLSRAQESSAKDRIGNPLSSNYAVHSSSPHSVADALFIERIKNRVGQWIKTCKGSNKSIDDALVRSLSKIILGGEQYGSRSCLNIDVCSERQVQLVLEMLKEGFESVVPLIIPAKGGGTQAVRIVLTSSKEDRELFEKELQNVEEDQSKRIRGFREVIDLISTSQKPVVAHNSLNDLTFIHSKFLSPLPPTIDEFRSSLRSVFPHVLDVNHLMKEVGPLDKVINLPAALSFTRRRFFAPINVEIPQKAANVEEDKIHGRNVLRITELFAKLCSILKVSPEAVKNENVHLPPSLEGYANIFIPGSTSSQDPIEGDISVWNRDTRKVSSKDLVFLWGFRSGISAGMLKNLLHGSHDVFSEDLFDIRLVDKSCAIIVFWNSGSSECFLKAMDSGAFYSKSLEELISEGLRAASYETYNRACQWGLWGANLADSLDKALDDFDGQSEAQSADSAEIYWNNESIINLDDL